nr:ScyD/ScyE family protein [Ornithinimicrobium pratense]
MASGLVGPLSLDVGKGKDLYVTQNFMGVLSKITQRGGVETVTSLTNPETQSLGGVAHHRGATYHLEADFGGEMPASHVVKIDKRGERSVVSGNFWEHEMTNNPDAGTRYGFVGLRGSCAAQLAEFEAAFPEELQGTPFLQEYTGIVESNAYQLTVAEDGTIYVADAAANAILKMNRQGDISAVAVLPASTVQFTAELEEGYQARLEGFVADTGIEMNTDVPDCVVGKTFTPSRCRRTCRSGTRATSTSRRFKARPERSCR